MPNLTENCIFICSSLLLRDMVTSMQLLKEREIEKILYIKLCCITSMFQDFKINFVEKEYFSVSYQNILCLLSTQSKFYVNSYISVKLSYFKIHFNLISYNLYQKEKVLRITHLTSNIKMCVFYVYMCVIFLLLCYVCEREIYHLSPSL